LRKNMHAARPDVQPDVVKCLAPSVWGLSQYIGGGVAPQNILRYDGGSGERSGQLSWPLDDLGVNLTSEVDLLHATPSPELLAEADWKTGWGTYDEDTVRNAFQFEFHWLIIANCYPDVQALRVTVWNTRIGKRTHPVEFKRSDLPAIEARVRSAVGEYLRWHGKPYELADTWPTSEKCRICDAAAVCPAANRATSECAKDPNAFVDNMASRQAQLNAMAAEAKAFVTKTKRDIVTPAGNCFGREKPKQSRAAKTELYSNGAKEDGNDD
jgi:hypothetical protein